MNIIMRPSYVMKTDLAFPTDIKQYMSELKLILLWKNQLVCKLFQHICAYAKKIELLQANLGRATLSYFTCLAARKAEFSDLDSTNYAAENQKLRDEFTSRYPEFKRDEIKVKLFANPFDLAVDDSPDNCQMKLIESQAEMDTKRHILKIVWWAFTKLMLVESFSICTVMEEKLSPSLVAHIAVSKYINK